MKTAHVSTLIALAYAMANPALAQYSCGQASANSPTLSQYVCLQPLVGFSQTATFSTNCQGAPISGGGTFYQGAGANISVSANGQCGTQTPLIYPTSDCAPAFTSAPSGSSVTAWGTNYAYNFAIFPVPFCLAQTSISGSSATCTVSCQQCSAGVDACSSTGCNTPGGYSCVSGCCIAGGGDGTGGEGSGCESDADCASGDTCDDGTCAGSCTPNEGNSCGGCGTIQCDDSCNDPCDGGTGNSGGTCSGYQNAFGSWICNGQFCSNGCDGTGCNCAPTDPIMIDLTGNGYKLTDVARGVKFDFSGKGNSVLTSWTAGGWNGGFLALDRNGNGKIDNGTELFGNLTPQPTPAKGKTANGFLALAIYDEPANGGNGDGWIDEHDAIYSKLVIWIDTNHNGVSEPDELLTLKQAGVQAISLNDSASQWKDAFGNLFRYRSQIRDNAPGNQIVYDVLLEQAVPNKAAMTTLTKQ